MRDEMFAETELPGVIEVHPRLHGDARGYLCETFSAQRYRAGGIEGPFVQDNLSFSRARGTVRGLHLQLPPHAQGKLVTCLAGRIIDVAVDLRPGSATYGNHVAVELTARRANQLYVPEGFAHGFCTLEEDCLVTYKMTRPYVPEAERSLAFDDRRLAIDWPVSRDGSAILSARDAQAPGLDALERELAAGAGA